MTFDFIFYGSDGRIDKLNKYSEVSEEIGRTLKPEGYVVVHTRTNDTYSLHSFIALFNCCTFIKSREIQGFVDGENGGESVASREIVMKKEDFTCNHVSLYWSKECSIVPGYKQEIV